MSDRSSFVGAIGFFDAYRSLMRFVPCKRTIETTDRVSLGEVRSAVNRSSFKEILP
jgi:hypothetical protein